MSHHIVSTITSTPTHEVFTVAGFTGNPITKEWVGDPIGWKFFVGTGADRRGYSSQDEAVLAVTGGSVPI